MAWSCIANGYDISNCQIVKDLKSMEPTKIDFIQEQKEIIEFSNLLVLKEKRESKSQFKKRVKLSQKRLNDICIWMLEKMKKHNAP